MHATHEGHEKINMETAYPRFATYQSLKRNPTVVTQGFENTFEIQNGKILYPRNERLEQYFTSSEASLKFGAAQFCGFLHDTIAVEHYIVIPSILAIEQAQFNVPARAIQELYNTVTDEGYHAAQALSFLSSIKSKFDIEILENENQLPLFVRRLKEIKRSLGSSFERALFDIVCGVVTETRISIELGQFATNKELMDSVREICKSHQSDEDIHSSQFRAIGLWTWSQSNESTRQLLAELYAKVTIARSMPDAGRIGFYFSQVMELDRIESQRIVDSKYTPETLRNDMMIAAIPTIRFLGKMGVLEYKSARDVFNEAGVKYE